MFLFGGIFISVIANISVLTTNENEPGYWYFSYLLIILIYIVSIILDVILFVLIINNLKKELTDSLNKIKSKKYISIVIYSNIILIWFELIYASIWYYGLGNHQGELIEANNWGIFGSIVFLTFLILYSNKKQSIKIILFGLILVLHTFLFLVLSTINILKF